MLSGIFSRNLKLTAREKTSLMMYYETLQYAVIYLLPTRENNLKVNKMTVKKKTLIVGLSF